MSLSLSQLLGGTGPQGVQGAQGTTGAQGALIQGAQGTVGSASAQGAQGTQGSLGVQGSNGAQGTSGSTSAQGAQGTQGSLGVQGSRGSQGTAGSTSAQGAQGTQGSQGAQGAQGTQGRQGTQGTQGTVGASYNQTLDTSSNVRFNSVGVGTTASGSSGELRATGNVIAYYSDERLKTILGPIENALDKVMLLNGYYYTGNELAKTLGYDTEKVQVGVKAQEVEKVLPEIVFPAPVDEKYITIQYEKIVPLLIEAIKELKSEIDDLKYNRE